MNQIRSAWTDERIAELEEENTYLRRQLAMEVDGDIVHRIRLKYRVTPHEATVLAVLFRANGRVVNKGAVFDLLPSRDRSLEFEDTKIVDVYVCRLRAKCGKASVETVWGKGIRLGEDFRRQLAALLSAEAA